MVREQVKLEPGLPEGGLALGLWGCVRRAVGLEWRRTIPDVKSKFVKFLLWCGVFGLLGVIILWIEHGRCAAQLAAYQRTLTARGDKLTLRELLPPDPPAASNAAVVLKRLSLRFSHQPEEVPWMELVSSNAARVALQHNPLVQTSRDLTWESLADVANANTNQLAEIAAASQLPRLATLTRTNLGRILEGSIDTVDVNQFQEWLGFHALVTAREGRTNEAWESWRALLRLSVLSVGEASIFLGSESFADGPFNVTWELLQHPDWTEAQLAEAQVLWSRRHHLSTSPAAEQLARAFVFEMFDELRRKPAYVAMVSGGAAFMSAMSSSSSGSFPSFDWAALISNPKPVWDFVSDAGPTIVAWPAWTSYGDELWLLREFDRSDAAVRTAVASNSVLVALAQFRAASPPPPSRWWPLARILSEMKVMEAAFARSVAGETQARLAVTALALRRHQLAHRQLPATLAELVPQFLPRVPDDPMDGKPLRYRARPDGSFLLYSIGWDGKDDGGDATEPPPTASHPADWLSFGNGDDSRWQKGRDWIWPLAATAEEVERHAASLLKTRTPGPGIPLPPPPPPP